LSWLPARRPPSTVAASAAQQHGLDSGCSLGSFQQARTEVLLIALLYMLIALISVAGVLCFALLLVRCALVLSFCKCA
jgi:hypothetical protein